MIKLIQRIVILFFIVSIAVYAAAILKDRSAGDTVGPEITMNADSVTVSIHDTEEKLLEGIEASDKKDGDVTDSLVVEGISNFIEKGRRQAAVAAFDHDNNVAKVTREIVYEDYVSPKFMLEEPLRFPAKSTNSYTGTLTVEDCLDGDLTNSIMVSIEDPDFVGEAGSWKYTYSVVNSAGDVAELPVTVEFYEPSEDNACPKVVLSEYLVYVDKGSRIDPWAYVEGVAARSKTWSLDELNDNEDTGAEYTRDDIQISNPVDSNKPGTYEVVYSMDGENAYQSHIRLIVVVEE